jgi:hypothetical protein
MLQDLTLPPLFPLISPGDTLASAKVDQPKETKQRKPHAVVGTAHRPSAREGQGRTWIYSLKAHEALVDVARLN